MNGEGNYAFSLRRQSFLRVGVFAHTNAPIPKGILMWSRVVRVVASRKSVSAWLSGTCIAAAAKP